MIGFRAGGRVLLTAAVALLASLLMSVGPGSPALAACGGWSIVPSPPLGTKSQVLSSVAAVSSKDVWAVGWLTDQTLGDVGLAEHWDGTAWNRVPVATTGSPREDFFSGLAALATNDVWAVGWSDNVTTSQITTLVEHWDGSAWTIVPSPNPDPRQSYFYDVATIPGTHQLWAVGSTLDLGTLIARWTGSRWAVVPSPAPGTTYNNLVQVSVSSTTDAWATGGYGTQTGQFPLAAHWDGTAWTVAPNPGGGGAGRIAALSPTDALSAGGDFERWNGSSWGVIGSAQGVPSDIAAKPTKGWAVGWTDPSSPRLTYTAQWDGTSWATVASPNVPGEVEDLLYGVTLVPGTSEAWAVGFSYHFKPHKQVYHTLIEHHC